MITDRRSDPAVHDAPSVPQGTTILVCSLMLPPVRSSPKRARDILTETLRQAGRTSLIDVFELVLSELVTNAIDAVAKAEARAPSPRGPAAVRVAVRCADPQIAYLRVFDCAPGQVKFCRPDDDQERGRGLVLVDALCPRWGVRPGRWRGKCVWAEIHGERPEPENCSAVRRPAWIPCAEEVVIDGVTGRRAQVVAPWKLSHCTPGLLLAEPGDRQTTWVRSLASVRPRAV